MSNIHVHVFRVVNPEWDYSEEQLDTARELASNVAEATRQWLTTFYHLTSTTVSVSSDLLMTAESTDHPYYAGGAVAEYKRQNPDIEWTHYHLIGGSTSSGYGGFGGPGKSVVFDPRAAMWLHLHEICGHGQLIGHMGRKLPNGAISEYGGYGIGASDGLLPDGYPYKYKGVLSPDRVRVVQYGESASSILYPIEADPLEVGDNYQLMELVDNTGDKFFVSFRRWAGAFTRQKSMSVKVDARYRNPVVAGNTKTLWEGDVAVGEELDVGSFTIRHHAFVGETVLISVVPKDSTIESPYFPDQELPFNKVGVSDLTQEHTGLWYHPDFDGQGFDVFVKDGYCLVGWYTYDSGQQRWYYMQGPVVDGIAVLDVYTSDGRVLTKVGDASLGVLGTGELFMQWLTTVHGRASCRLRSISSSQAVLEDCGWWHNPDREYQGIKTIALDNGTMIAYEFAYGDPIPGGPFLPPKPYSNQRFWMYQLTKDGDVYRGVRYNTAGGDYLSPKRVAIVQEPDEYELVIEGNALVLNGRNFTRLF